MAAYKAVLTVAEPGGRTEEKAMAQWPDEHIVSVTTKFLSFAKLA
ncbi:hypothetical protein [Rhizobium leguminosarum]|nr:hypothetical protein [Rhizobium leguminosarum]